MSNQPQTSQNFPYHKLDVYMLSLELCRLCNDLARPIVRRNAKLADQLKRASTGLPLLIAEGAHRYSAAQKRQRYEEARGEAAEIRAALDVATIIGLVTEAQVERASALADRIAAMLTKLVLRYR